MFRIGSLEFGGAPRVAVSFRDDVTSEAVQHARQLGMDLAEIRVDLFSSQEPAHVTAVAERFAGVSVLATIRSMAEGGQWRNSDAARLELFTAIIPHVDAIDIELSSGAILPDVIASARAHGKSVIVSFHDFSGTPALNLLQETFERAKDRGADIVKIATMCSTPLDLRCLAAFTLSRAAEGVVTIGMGRGGVLSRIFFPALGSLFTFAAYGEGTAPGQLSLAETIDCIRRYYAAPGSS